MAAGPRLYDAPHSENGNTCCSRGDDNGAPCRGKRRQPRWCRLHVFCRWLLVTTRRSRLELQSTNCTYFGKVQFPARLCSLVSNDNDSQRHGKNRFCDAKSGDSTNQSGISLESVRDIVDCVLYMCKSFSGSAAIKGVGGKRYCICK